MNKLFEEVIYESMPIDDLILEGAKTVSNFVDELKSITVTLDKFNESTDIGNFHKSKLDKICTNLVQINKSMKTHVDKKEKTEKSKIEAIIEGINQTDTPSILSILRIVFKKRENDVFDDEDRYNVHKICQVYDRLVGDFCHYLSQLKLIASNIDIRSISPPRFNMETKSAFKAVNIDTYINSLKNPK